MATNPAALLMVSDLQLLDVWNAMVDGAARSGPAGSTDRQSLFRAAGLPFSAGVGAPGSRVARVGGGSRGDGVVGPRLERALSRLHGRGAVTVSGSGHADLAAIQGWDGDAHKSQDHVPVQIALPTKAGPGVEGPSSIPPTLNEG